MKTLLLTALILIGTVTSQAGDNAINNAGCLEVSLHITYGKKTPKGTKVEVYDGRTCVYSSEKPEYFYFFRFWLQRDKDYTIVVSSEGFHVRKFSVSTWMPASVSQKMAYQLLKQVELVPDVVTYDPQSVSMPDEKIAFNEASRLFSHDMDYAAFVRMAQLNFVAQAEPTVPVTTAVK
ncbi:MAG: hypothetical protein IT233_04455 [Bacteroidia bacterium]|nr:hypothetical protein [Bacteroidia bacterium]